ncbi:unnamed protein product [Ilex paraguariensis]|uniref:Serine-threonine kinase receptor-associated protein n=1 Tax=Ilex paraguariensis TaxID=185542 RepID=A0ABC8SZ71_9AQUA
MNLHSHLPTNAWLNVGECVTVRGGHSTILLGGEHPFTSSVGRQQKTGESVLVIKGPQGRINRAVWGPLNTTIVSAGEDAVIRIWDSETGKLLKESDKETGHKKTVTSLSKSIDGSHFITGSLDKSAKLWDIRSLTLIKTYVTERPVNAVAMSPLLDHVCND